MKHLSRWYLVPPLVLLLWSVLPLVRGSDTLYLRDVLNIHLPMKWAQSEGMRQGYLPEIDPYRAGGQPLLGNPNAAPFYPDNLLYLVTPVLWALNAHFWVHFLLAPFTFFWLARAWGLEPRAAWAAGLTYTLSGYMVSQLNFYNLVAGVALAPGLMAACLDWGRHQRRSRTLLAIAVLWCLLILAGDPFLALISCLMAISAYLARGRRELRSAIPLAAAYGCGTLLAAPQLVEFFRILPLSFRGYWGFSPDWGLGASWDPRTVLEWLLPFAFGRPDLTFWGEAFFGGHPPFYFTLYPGLLSLGLVGASGWRPSRCRVWAWAWVAAGLFFSLGAWNPLVRLLFRAPGAQLLRFPVKCWLMVAVGGALLCGLGFERLLTASGRKVATRILASLTGLFLVAWIPLSFLPAAVEGWMRVLIPANFSADVVRLERLRWAGLCLLSMILLGLLIFLVLQMRQRPGLGGAVLLAVHVVAQLILLAPAMDTDSASFYSQPPELLSAVPHDALVAHGGFNDIFGEEQRRGLAFPDMSLRWVERRGHEELYPFAGARWGRRYELNTSPEGLDSFLTLAAYQAMLNLPDSSRLRLLAAFGVDVLILDRPLEAGALSQVRLRRRRPVFGSEIFVYEVLSAADELQFLGRVLRAPHLNAAVAYLTDPSFDPCRDAVLPGDGPPVSGAGGSLAVLRRSPESLEVQIEAQSAGVLLVQRAYLPLYRATVDGLPVRTTVANLHRLAVEVPQGSHRVRLWIDRRPLLVSLAGPLLAVVALAVLFRRFSRRTGA